ncbi:MAG: hypothetical protein U5R14_07925 [Gemmatimonadota bacterium]|nr:hypothetical protein [Gemmatimonadota bacterium]
MIDRTRDTACRRPASALPVVVALVLGTAVPGRIASQNVPEQPPRAPTPDVVLEEAPRAMPSPGGALLRSLAVPGWGHAAIGSYGRGAFYVAAQSGTIYALVRTRLRLSEARERAARRETVLRRALDAEGVSDPAVIQQRLEEDPRLADVRGLVSARESQQEDWLALGIFLVLLGGADAYVSAHLSAFPEPIEVGVLPGPAGGVELAARVPVRGP